MQGRKAETIKEQVRHNDLRCNKLHLHRTQFINRFIHNIKNTENSVFKSTKRNTPQN